MIEGPLIYSFFFFFNLHLPDSVWLDEDWRHEVALNILGPPLSRVWLLVTPWTVAHQAPLSIGFSRQEHWSGLPFLPSGIFPTQGSNLVPCISCTGRRILYHLEPSGKSLLCISQNEDRVPDPFSQSQRATWLISIWSALWKGLTCHSLLRLPSDDDARLGDAAGSRLPHFQLLPWANATNIHWATGEYHECKRYKEKQGGVSYNLVMIIIGTSKSVNLRIFCLILYYFARAAVINWHKPGYLKQKLTVSQLWCPESEIKLLAWLCSLSGLQKVLPHLFHLLAAPSSSGLWRYPSGLCLCLCKVLFFLCQITFCLSLL